MRAFLLCATAALLPVGYVLAAGVPLLLAWVWENATRRRWPWEPSPVDRPLLVWVVVVAASAALSPHPDLALPNGVLLALGPVAAFAPALRTLKERPGLLRHLCAAWAAGGVVAGAWVVWRYAHAGGSGRGDLPELGWNAAGTVLVAASLLALGLLLAAGPRWRALVAAAQVPVLAGLLATLSRGAWLGWVVGVVCATLLTGPVGRRLRWAGLGLSLAAVLAVAAVPQARARALSVVDLHAHQDRVLLWKAALRMVADHPWVGVGFGAFVREYPNYRLPGDPNTTPPFAHNLPLSLAVETGVPGLVAFLVFLVRLMQLGLKGVLRGPPELRALRAAAAGAMVGILAHQLVDGTLQSFHLGFAFWLLAGGLLAPYGTRSSEVEG